MNNASTTQALFIHSAELDQYRYPPDCPFKTERAGMTRDMLISMGLLGDGEQRAPIRASRGALERFHAPRYLDVLAAAERGDLTSEGLFMGLGTPETPVFIGMTDYAALACGATLTAVDAVASGAARAAFNPSGGYHHAFPEKASGFCYVNDVALACLKLADAGKRVLFVDIDVHHCDGVQAAFYDRRDVMTLSFHESGEVLFPGTGFVGDVGEGEGKGYAVNVPFPPGVYDEAWLRAFRTVAPPLAGAFDPDVVVLEVGMDCLSGDPLAHLALTNNAYADAAAEVLRWGKPVVATGGGGYHPRNTARGWALVWTVLAGRDVRDDMTGLGGVMMETADWHGGLRDRVLAPDEATRLQVDRALDATLEAVKAKVFGIHGL